jgi:outer membrane cobalamin receptor
MANHDENSRQSKRRALSVAISATEEAQNNERSNSLLEEVIVTATKREANLQDVPMSVMAFTNADIVREGFKQLDDYAGSIPSLAYGRREPGHHAWLRSFRYCL